MAVKEFSTEKTVSLNIYSIMGVEKCTATKVKQNVYSGGHQIATKSIWKKKTKNNIYSGSCVIYSTVAEKWTANKTTKKSKVAVLQPPLQTFQEKEKKYL